MNDIATEVWESLDYSNRPQAFRKEDLVVQVSVVEKGMGGGRSI